VGEKDNVSVKDEKSLYQEGEKKIPVNCKKNQQRKGKRLQEGSNSESRRTGGALGRGQQERMTRGAIGKKGHASQSMGGRGRKFK